MKNRLLNQRHKFSVPAHKYTPPWSQSSPCDPAFARPPGNCSRWHSCAVPSRSLWCRASPRAVRHDLDVGGRGFDDVGGGGTHGSRSRRRARQQIDKCRIPIHANHLAINSSASPCLASTTTMRSNVRSAVVASPLWSGGKIRMVVRVPPH